MKRIVKTEIPRCLQAFIDDQRAIEPTPTNLTYRDFREKENLLAILTTEQFGLCGYTGAPVDERIRKLENPNENERVVFKNHIEHLKCQATCQEELRRSGGEYGRDFCDDLNYLNMIAALEVRGAESEHFGAVAKKNLPLPILPTHEECSEYFKFRQTDGGVEGLNENALKSISVLHLGHATLNGWRKSAIDAWLDPNAVTTREDFENVVAVMENPKDGVLPEFAFVIGAIAKEYL